MTRIAFSLAQKDRPDYSKFLVWSDGTLLLLHAHVSCSFFTNRPSKNERDGVVHTYYTYHEYHHRVVGHVISSSFLRPLRLSLSLSLSTKFEDIISQKIVKKPHHASCGFVFRWCGVDPSGWFFTCDKILLLCEYVVSFEKNVNGSSKKISWVTREIHKFTLSLDLLSTPNPLFFYSVVYVKLVNFIL